MDIKALLVEKIFIIVIILYLVLIFRYRWRIMRSRFFQKHYIKVERFGENLRLWYRHLTFVKVLKLTAVSTLLVLIMLGGYTVYARLHPEKRFHRLINECDALVKEKKYEQAIIDMTNALKIKPDYVKGLYFLASVYQTQNKMDNAEAALYRIMKLEPDYRDSAQKLESILIEKKDAKALKDLGKQLSKNMPVESKIMLARGFVLENKISEAMAILEEAGKIAPKNYRIYQYLGMLHVMSGKSDEAMKAFEKALDLNFGNWEAHYALAGLYLEKGRIEDAQSELRTTLSLNPDFNPPVITLAQIHYNKKEYDISAKLLEDILAKDREEFEAVYALGLVYVAMGRYQDAINQLIRLPDVYHGRKNYQYNQSVAYYHTEKYYESLKWLSMMVEAKTIDIPAIKLLARVQTALGLYEDTVKTLQLLDEKGWLDRDDSKLLALAKASIGTARKEIQKVRSDHDSLEGYLRNKDYQSLIAGAKKAIAENKFKAPFYNLLGVAYMATGNIEEAKKNFNASYNERRDNPGPLKNLVNIYIREGKINEAENLLKDHNRLFSGETETRMILANLYLITGKTGQALALYQRVAELAPEFYEPYQKMAIVSGNMGDMKAAVKNYQKAIELNPNDAISLNDLASIFAEQKNTLALAEKYALKAKNLIPQNGRIVDTLGWVMHRKGELKEALSLFNDAYRLNPYLPIIPYHMGLVQFELKNYAEAEKNLTLALNMKGHFRDAEKVNAEEILRKVSSLLKDSKSGKELSKAPGESNRPEHIPSINSG